LRLRERLPLPTGQKLALELYGERRETTLPLVGDFQALNVLAALGLVIACGSELAPAAAALERLTGVPGRMQPVGATPDGSPVFVDYAHTPDALATVLNGLRPHTQHRLVVVFGAGGDRDRGKRPLMGETAARLADQVYVTDDNPRSEDPAAIRHAIIAAAPGAIEIGDRRAAIGAAIEALRAGDVLVIAGKGHETGQIVGTEVHPFDDAVVAREALASGARR
jgi:UDP-N-acetylmuramoyl-L-alanyl-D-glutamate--2,6-diaminopimelate ligase